MAADSALNYPKTVTHCSSPSSTAHMTDGPSDLYGDSIVHAIERERDWAGGACPAPGYDSRTRYESKRAANRPMHQNLSHLLIFQKDTTGEHRQCKS